MSATILYVNLSDQSLSDVPYTSKVDILSNLWWLYRFWHLKPVIVGFFPAISEA